MNNKKITNLNKAKKTIADFGMNLRQVSEDLLDKYPELVLEAAKDYPPALKCVSQEFQRKHPKIVTEVLDLDYVGLEGVNPDFQDSHPDIVMEKIKQNGVELQYVTRKLQNNKEIVMEAVKQNAWALEYASSRLKDDIDIVYNALKENCCIIRFADEFISPRLQKIFSKCECGKVSIFDKLPKEIFDDGEEEYFIEIISEEEERFRQYAYYRDNPEEVQKIKKALSYYDLRFDMKNEINVSLKKIYDEQKQLNRVNNESEYYGCYGRDVVYGETSDVKIAAYDNEDFQELPLICMVTENSNPYIARKKDLPTEFGETVEVIEPISDSHILISAANAFELTADFKKEYNEKVLSNDENKKLIEETLRPQISDKELAQSSAEVDNFLYNYSYKKTR